MSLLDPLDLLGFHLFVTCRHPCSQEPAPKHLPLELSTELIHMPAFQRSRERSEPQRKVLSLGLLQLHLGVNRLVSMQLLLPAISVLPQLEVRLLVALDCTLVELCLSDPKLCYFPAVDQKRSEGSEFGLGVVS